VSVYFHVFHNSGDSDIQQVWDYYWQKGIVTVGYRTKGREFGKRKISKYEYGDEILVYAKDENNKTSGLVGYAEVDKNSVLEFVEDPFETLNSPIDHRHILTVNYTRYVERVENAIIFRDIADVLGDVRPLLRQTVGKYKYNQYDDVLTLVNRLPKARPAVSPPSHLPSKGRGNKTYKDFGDAPNDNPEELQNFAARVRRGQIKFRENLLKAYGGKCAISGHGPKEVLEAVHIAPHAKTGINELDNGLLLRCDLHSLFDAQLLHINPTGLTIVIDRSLKNTPYWNFNGKPLRAKVNGSYIRTEYLQQRWDAIK
jgi:hypothetical protein